MSEEDKSAPSGVASTRGRWATAQASWQILLDELPEWARPFFALPPSADIADFKHYLAIAKLALGQTEHPDHLVALRARNFTDTHWRQQTLRRVELTKIESALRPAARAVLQELLEDGQRSAEEIGRLAVQYASLALSGPSGLAEVRELVPNLDMQLVEGEAIARSLAMTETLINIQAVLENQMEKAIDNLDYATESAGNRYRTHAELSHETESTKKSSRAQQVKQ